MRLRQMHQTMNMAEILAKEVLINSAESTEQVRAVSKWSDDTSQKPLTDGDVKYGQAEQSIFSGKHLKRCESDRAKRLEAYLVITLLFEDEWNDVQLHKTKMPQRHEVIL